MTRLEAAPIGIVSVSDRASRGDYEDRGAPTLEAYLHAILINPWRAVTRVVPDEQALIEATLCALCDDHGCSLVLTTGGTGPAPRDVTPEATAAIADKILPGFGEQMRRESLRFVPTAILARQQAVIRGRSLIINLPGSPKAIGQCLDAVFPAIPHCLKLIGGHVLRTDPDRLTTTLHHPETA